MIGYREYVLRVPLEVEIERYKYINERATSFLGYPLLEEVVRCRDCKYHVAGKCYVPKFHITRGTYTEDSGFCDWGERR